MLALWVGLSLAQETALEAQLQRLEDTTSAAIAAREAAVLLDHDACVAALDVQRSALRTSRDDLLTASLAAATPVGAAFDGARGLVAMPIQLATAPPPTAADKSMRVVRAVQNALGVVGSLTTTAGLILSAVPFPDDVSQTVDAVSGGVAAGGAALNMVGSIVGLVAGGPKAAGVSVPIPTKRSASAPPVRADDPAARAVAVMLVERVQGAQRRLGVFLDVRGDVLGPVAALAPPPGDPTTGAAAVAVAPVTLSRVRDAADQLQVELATLMDSIDQASSWREVALVEGFDALRDQVHEAQLALASWRGVVPSEWDRAAWLWALRPEAEWTGVCPAPAPPGRPRR